MALPTGEHDYIFLDNILVTAPRLFPGDIYFANGAWSFGPIPAPPVVLPPSLPTLPPIGEVAPPGQPAANDPPKVIEEVIVRGKRPRTPQYPEIRIYSWMINAFRFAAQRAGYIGLAYTLVDFIRDITRELDEVPTVESDGHVLFEPNPPTSDIKLEEVIVRAKRIPRGIRITFSPLPQPEPAPQIVPVPARPQTFPDDDPANDPEYDPDDDWPLIPVIPPPEPEPEPEPIKVPPIYPEPWEPVPAPLYEPEPDTEPQPLPAGSPATPSPAEQPLPGTSPFPDPEIETETVPNVDPDIDTAPFPVRPSPQQVPDIPLMRLTIRALQGKIELRIEQMPKPRQGVKNRWENWRRKDRKKYHNKAYKAMLRLVTMTFGTATELADLYHALKWNIKYQGEFLGQMSLDEVAAFMEGLSNGQIDMSELEINWEQAIIDLAVMQATDMVIGKMSQLSGEARANMDVYAPGPGGLDTNIPTPWIN